MTQPRTVFSFLSIFALAMACGQKSNFLANSSSGPKKGSDTSAVSVDKKKAEVDATASEKIDKVEKTEKIEIQVQPAEVMRKPTEDQGSLKSSKPFGTADDGKSPGVVGTVYDFQGVKYSSLPDFKTLPQRSKIILTNFDIPKRDFLEGFPGQNDLVEYFGISFDGKLLIDQAGVYEFTLASDDGSKLFINDSLVVDNDGLNQVTKQVSGKIELSKGAHKFHLDYFQGPRVSIALQLYWKKPGQDIKEIVPASALGRPD